MQLTSAAYAAMRNGRQLAEELREVRKGWETTVKARRRTNTWRIADLLLRRPVINASLVAEELGIHPNNVYRPLAPLADVGVLREATDRRRNRIWRCDQVLVALDDFAARAGRRQDLSAILEGQLPLRPPQNTSEGGDQAAGPRRRSGAFVTSVGAGH